MCESARALEQATDTHGFRRSRGRQFYPQGKRSPTIEFRYKSNRRQTIDCKLFASHRHPGSHTNLAPMVPSIHNSRMISFRSLRFVGLSLVFALAVQGCKDSIDSDANQIRQLFVQLKEAVVTENHSDVVSLVIPSSRETLRRLGPLKFFSEFRRGPAYFNNHKVLISGDTARFLRGNEYDRNIGTAYKCLKQGTNWFITLNNENWLD
jgi:hypothetical protein